MGDILFLAHRVPFPPDRGDKIRSFNILKHLAACRRVHLIGFADDDGDEHAAAGLDGMIGDCAIIRREKPRWRAGIEGVLGARPVSLAAFDDRAMRDAVDAMLAHHPIDTIYVYSSQMAQYLPANGPQRVIMDFVDVDSAKFDAYAQASRGPKSWLMAREGRLLAAYEREIAMRVDASLLVSVEEAALFRARTGAPRVHAIDNGIDTSSFDPDAAFAPVEARGDLIVFTGQMDYPPNVEAVTWFADHVLPVIQAERPDARFAIVGRRPTDAVRALGRRRGVMVTGQVADVRGWLAAAAVVVAPLRLARGIQNKVLEAMAMARPVVASPAAAEGIDHQGTIMVADDPQQFAAATIGLLADADAAAALGAGARARVQHRYGWAACLAPLDELMGLTQTTTAAEPHIRTAA